jgi:trk system potassium uptake protein TrkH
VLAAAEPSIDGAITARRAVFTVTSVMTTTGFGIDDFSIWPLALAPLVLFLSFTGACAGSTSGGMKLVRFVVLARQAGIHVRRLIHPNLVQTVKLDRQVVPASVIDGVWGFFTVYMFTFAVLMLALMMLGMDHISAFGAVAACLNNLGPGLGSVALSFAGESDAVLHLMSFAMLLGRLEIFTLLVLMSPEFWRG